MRLPLLLVPLAGIAPAFVAAHITPLPHFKVPRADGVITFRDHTNPRWGPLVQDEAQRWTRAFAAAGFGITILYDHRGPKDCSDIAWRDKDNTISFCSPAIMGDGPGCPGCGATAWHVLSDNLHLRSALIQVEDSDTVFSQPGLALAILCHEIGHALTAAGHPNLDETVRPSVRKPEAEWVDTCIYPTHGDPDDPGQWDIGRLATAYS
jgi:hypothetical protein